MKGGPKSSLGPFLHQALQIVGYYFTSLTLKSSLTTSLCLRLVSPSRFAVST